MKKKIYTILFSAALFTITTSAIMSSVPGHLNSLMEPDGIADRTGNPINATCTECHSGTVNSGGGALTISVKDSKGNAVTAYEINQTYTVDVLISQANVSKYGFNAEIVTSANTNAGTLMAGTGQKLLQGKKSTNVVHSMVATASPAGSYTFTFTWKTPATNVGEVTIYAAGNAANGNGSTSGDKIYNSSKKLNSNSGVEDLQKPVSTVSIYPNPVNAVLNLSYNLREAGNVNVTLYAINGKKIAELINAKQVAGLQQHALELPATVGNGIYLLQISTGGSSSFQKIIVQK